ncbi:cysteine hydrolase family protein [Nocardioides salsibiostraticola]
MGTLNGTRTALLVVDVQQANTNDGYERTEVYGRIRGLISRAKAVDAPVLWIQHETQGGPMDPGSDGWRIVPEVAPTAGETVIAKRYLDAFTDTPLRDTLNELEVGRLVICGAATDACIRTTTMRALIEGYDTTLVSDSHTTDVGPWDLPLPDGRTVSVGAEQMIAFTNFFVEDTQYPGVTTEVVPAEQIEF